MGIFIYVLLFFKFRSKVATFEISTETEKSFTESLCIHDAGCFRHCLLFVIQTCDALQFGAVLNFIHPPFARYELKLNIENIDFDFTQRVRE